MSSSRKTIIAIAAFALFIALALVAYNALTGGADLNNGNAGNTNTTISGNPVATSLPTSAPRTAPDFTVYDQAGEPVRLIDFAGRPVVLNFWASWCGPCKAEMPIFDKVHQEMGTKIDFLMLNLVDGQRETVETGLAYLKDGGYSFKPYFDSKQQAANKYGITAIPSTYFINAEGEIIYFYRGAMDEAHLRAAIALIAP
ncbi:MAG: TlpA family protein disulfide reductase [Ruminococcaceae bacterium]|nr:TlpA family protein disulfide reductase [Oscillospiraceae bacterium]